jgi:phospholipid-transporting ATPase
MTIVFEGIIFPNGSTPPLYFVGTIIFSGILLTCTLKAALLINNWTIYSTVGLLIGPISWVIYVMTYDWFADSLDNPVVLYDLGGISKPLFASIEFWALSLLVPIVCLLRDFGWKFYKRQFRPQKYHLIQEAQKEALQKPI